MTGIRANMVHNGSKPVVIQTMWRTGGTYLSFMLRERNPVSLFYEPLHEDYSKYTKQDWDRFSEEGAQYSRGHPKKDFHYLTDYPFQTTGGVCGHESSFAWYPFSLNRHDTSRNLERYLLGLRQHASDQAKRPLFKFCRAFLRQDWIEGIMEPVTVYLLRAPAGMIKSYMRINSGSYFFSSYIRIIMKNRYTEPFAGIFEYISHIYPELNSLDENIVDSDKLLTLVDAEMAHDIFLFFWALALVTHCKPHILMVDINELGYDTRVTNNISEKLSKHIQLEVDFSDAKPLDARNEEIVSFIRKSEFSNITKSAVDFIASEVNYSSLSKKIENQISHLIL